MVTYNRYELEKAGGYVEGKGKFAFSGLSSDTKPTEAVDDIEIANGSSFLEIDTKDVKFFDEASREWR